MIELRKDNSDQEEQKVADALEDIVVHLPNIPATATGKRESEEDNSHLFTVTTDNVDGPSAFLANLQTIFVTHTLSKAIPARYPKTFETS